MKIEINFWFNVTVFSKIVKTEHGGQRNLDEMRKQIPSELLSGLKITPLSITPSFREKEKVFMSLSLPHMTFKDK